MTARVRPVPDGSGGWYVWVDGACEGHVFPAVISHEEGVWYGKRVGLVAQPRMTEKSALDYVVGRPYELEEIE